MMQKPHCLRTAALAAVTALVALAALALPGARQTQAALRDPVDALVAGVNNGDGAAAAAAFTPDGIFTDHQPDGAFGLVGARALQVGFADDTGTHVKLSDVTTSSNLVQGTAFVTDDDSRAAGVKGYLEHFSGIVRDDKLASFELTYVTSDADTAAYLAYLAKADAADDNGPPPGALAFDMNPGRDGAQTGTTIFADGGDGVTFVSIEMQTETNRSNQTARLVEGDCPGVGALVSPLASLEGGASFNIISMSLSDLQSGDFAVRVAASADTPDQFVSCGETESATAFGAPAEPVAPAAPEAPAAPARPITAPSTGMGPDDARGTSAWLLAMLALAGLACVAAGASVRSSRRTR